METDGKVFIEVELGISLHVLTLAIVPGKFIKSSGMQEWNDRMDAVAGENLGHTDRNSGDAFRRPERERHSHRPEEVDGERW